MLFANQSRQEDRHFYLSASRNPTWLSEHSRRLTPFVPILRIVAFSYRIRSSLRVTGDERCLPRPTTSSEAESFVRASKWGPSLSKPKNELFACGLQLYLHGSICIRVPNNFSSRISSPLPKRRPRIVHIGKRKATRLLFSLLTS